MKGSTVKYPPLGLCLKKGRENTENEANALLLVEKYTSINAPRVIDSVMMDDESGWILTTRMLGDKFDTVRYRMTYEEEEQLGKDLYNWVCELRKIPNSSNYLIANASGGPITDHQHNDMARWGPFNSVGDFTNRWFQDLYRPELFIHKKPLSVLHEKKYEVYFTHSDLHPSNIFVRNGRLYGLIDFEDSGFKPEYWEYTRAMWCTGGDRIVSYPYKCAFGCKYDEEWEAATLLIMHSQP